MNLKANVFLVDYGNTVEVDVKKSARKLQLKDQAAEPHLAFKIILEGLYPVSMVKLSAIIESLLKLQCCRTLTGCQETDA